MDRGRSIHASRISEKKRLQEQISGHRTGLPDRLLRLFAARPPLPPYKGPRRKPPKLPYTGIAQYIQHFAEPGDPDYEPPPPETRPPEPRIFRNPELATQARVDIESKVEKDLRLREERLKRAAEQREETARNWDPSKDPTIQGDPFKTLFVGRLSYDVTERKLKREFEEYGPIKSIRLVHKKNSGKPRGYAFIEYEHKNDMKQAYKVADGRKIEDRRVLVDVERGRTVPGWRPRRLGGGKGGESRLVPRPPKDLKRQFVARLVERALAEKERLMRKEPEREDRPRDRSRNDDDRERERERERAARDRGDRERAEKERGDRERAERERGDRDRAERERLRDRSRERDRERDRERTNRDRPRDRSRDRDRKRERSRSRDRGRDRDDYDRRDRSSKRARERDL